MWPSLSHAGLSPFYRVTVGTQVTQEATDMLT